MIKASSLCKRTDRTSHPVALAYTMHPSQLREGIEGSKACVRLSRAEYAECHEEKVARLLFVELVSPSAGTIHPSSPVAVQGRRSKTDLTQTRASSIVVQVLLH